MEATQDLRELPAIQNIAEYLRTMTFRKKLFGGYDSESVLEHFSAVTLQYEAIISAFMQQVEIQAGRLAEAQAQLQGKGPDYNSAAPAFPQEPPMPQPWQAGAPAFPQQQAQPFSPWEQPQQPYAAPNPWAQQPQIPSFVPWEQPQQPAAPPPVYSVPDAWAQQPQMPPAQPFDPWGQQQMPPAPQPAYTAPDAWAQQQPALWPGAVEAEPLNMGGYST